MKIATKTASYAVMHFIISITVSYFISGSVYIALGIGLIEPLAQIGGYSLHEFIWTKIIGKKSDKENK
jgi:uncharacterized membrane protein